MAKKERRERVPGESEREAPEDTDRSIDEKVAAMRAGRGLGGRTLGEKGTTGGTTVEADRLNGVLEEGRMAAGHPYDPGMGGRTARGPLGRDLDSGAGDDEGERRSNQAGLPESDT